MMGCECLDAFVVRVLSSWLDADGADKGIIPLTTSELFRRVEDLSSKDPNLQYTVEVSYIEIYNEKKVSPYTRVELKLICVGFVIF